MPTRAETRELLAIGAAARIRELEAEIARLRKIAGPPTSLDKLYARAVKREANQPRKRRPMSAKAKKAIGDAARKRWKKWRAEKKAKAK